MLSFLTSSVETCVIYHIPHYFTCASFTCFVTGLCLFKYLQCLAQRRFLILFFVECSNERKVTLETVLETCGKEHEQTWVLVLVLPLTCCIT